MSHPRRIAVPAFTGCFSSGISGFVDTLEVANLKAGRRLFEVSVVSEDGMPVAPFAGFSVVPCSSLDAIPLSGLDALYVPPAHALGHPPEGLTHWIGTAHARGAVACAACAGVFLLASAGILTGRRATTHWGLVAEFRERHPDVDLCPDELLIDGGDYICAGGVTAYFDLALHLIARFASSELAATCARTLLLDPGRVHQTPYMNLIGSQSHGDGTVSKAQQWLQDNHASPLHLDRLAAHVHLGKRTLLRRFKKATGRTPGNYLQALRIEHAKRLLETTTEPVDRILRRVGYTDAPAFFRRFKTMTGLTPGEYRARFGLVRPRADAAQ